MGLDSESSGSALSDCESVASAEKEDVKPVPADQSGQLDSAELPTTIGTSSRTRSRRLRESSDPSVRNARIMEDLARLWPDKAFRPDRPREAVERENEIERGVNINVDRQLWEKQTLAHNHPKEWSARHQLTYRNDGLQTNTKSYFDRWIDYKEPKDPPLGAMKPSWRLNPEASSPDERKVARDAIEQFSACFREAADPSRLKIPRRLRIENGHVFERLYEDAKQIQTASPDAVKPVNRQAGSRPLPGGGGDCVSQRKINAESASVTKTSTSVAEASKAPDSGLPGEAGWDERHHLGWSNELSILLPYRSTSSGASRRLIPSVTRHYFDRPRAHSQSPGLGVVPDWRLEPLGTTSSTLTETFADLSGEQNGVAFGRNFVQIGRFRLANIDDRHLSIAHQAEESQTTLEVFRADGSVHSGPRQDQHAFRRHVGGPPHGIFFGDRFMQVGPWRIADIDGQHLSIACLETRQTAIVYCHDGSVLEGPTADWQAFDRGPGKAHGVHVGTRCLDIGSFRLADVDGQSFQIMHEFAKRPVIVYTVDCAGVPGSGQRISCQPPKEAPHAGSPLIRELRSELQSYLSPTDIVTDASDYYIISNIWGWDNPVKMQPIGNIYSLDMEISTDRPEFQILLDGRFDKRIHPAERNTTDPSLARHQGPHNRGKGYNWVIAWGKEGQRATIRLKAGETGWMNLSWTPTVDVGSSSSALSSSKVVKPPLRLPGGGGSPCPPIQRAPPVGSPEDDRGVPLTSVAAERRHKWQERHWLLFKNEEVSRLDRSYFDRFREPEAFRPQQKGAQLPGRGSTLVWSLEKSGSTEEEARTIRGYSEARHQPAGKWNRRHHVCFDNGLQVNLRSYFGRPRQPPDLTGKALPDEQGETADSVPKMKPYRARTESALRGMRDKVTEDEKLPVSWKLQDAKRKYNVKLKKNKDATLGIVADRFDDFVARVVSIKDGLIKVWNDANPEAEVKVGDFIIEANGIRNDSDRILYELWNPVKLHDDDWKPSNLVGELSMTLQRGDDRIRNMGYAAGLRASRSDPTLAARRQKRRCDGWNGRHSIDF